MIGFTHLSEAARELEEAAHNLDDAYIAANHGDVINQCKETALFISGLLGLHISFTDPPASDGDSEVAEFGAEDGDVLEFEANDGEDVLEFGADDEEVLEFTPAEGGDQ